MNDVLASNTWEVLAVLDIILGKILDHNRQEFTETNPEEIPTIAVLEETQSVLESEESSHP